MGEPRILIAGTGSGCGKTTITCGILYGLMKQGLSLIAYKCGPDYIDPMFHSKVLGIDTGNLDSFFTDEDTLCGLLHNKSGDIAVIEGVMGYYDGIGFTERGSSSHIASITKTPVVLVINAKGMSRSILAVLQGFIGSEEDSQIKGVIFNNLSPMLYPKVKEEVSKLGVNVLGYVPYVKESVLESRHLGLITANEVVDFREKIDTFYQVIKDTVDFDGIIELANTAPNIEDKLNLPTDSPYKGLNIGVAKDNAFCFIYKDNIDLLEKLGCTIKYFSPLEDKELPTDIDALLLYGGYPENYGEELSSNLSMINSIREAIHNGIPTIAECGGYMYLHNQIECGDGNIYPMVGVIDGECYRTDKLRRFGYITMEAKEDSLICEQGDILKAHEFHYYDSTNLGDGFQVSKTGNGTTWAAGIVNENMYAGYPHIYFYGNLKATYRFLDTAKEYRKKQNG